MNLLVVIFFHRSQLKPTVTLVLMLPPSVQRLLFNRYSFYPIEICGFVNVKLREIGCIKNNNLFYSDSLLNIGNYMY